MKVLGLSCTALVCLNIFVDVVVEAWTPRFVRVDESIRSGALLLPQAAVWSSPKLSLTLLHSQRDDDVKQNLEENTEDDSSNAARSAVPRASSSSSSEQEQQDLNKPLPLTAATTTSSTGRSSSPFAVGMELKLIRSELEHLRESLMWAEAVGDVNRVVDLKQAMAQYESRDPDRVYAKSLQAISQLQGRFDLKVDDKQSQIHVYQKQARLARARLPRFQMEGLWVGTYGNQGFQLINVTYSGDTLIATKVTGDTDVPRGQVSFTADLAPDKRSVVSKNDTLAQFLPAPSVPSPSTTSPSSSPSPSSWLMARYPGKGQVAKSRFTNNKYVEGNFLVEDDNDHDRFVFLWAGIPDGFSAGGGNEPLNILTRRHQTFHVSFSRPTPEQTIRLLRDIVSREDEMDNMRQHLSRCLDMDVTEALARHHAKEDDCFLEPYRRISLQKDWDSFEQKQRQQQNNGKKDGSTWSLHHVQQKWKKYVEGGLSALRNQPEKPM